MAKVIFLQNTWYEHLGFMALSAMIKAHGHHSDLGIFTDPKEAATFANEGCPDILAISCTTGVHIWALNVAREFKKQLDIPIILGGPHPTYFPEIVEDSAVDIVCRGEGEYPLLELMNAIEEGKDYTHIKNLWVKKDSGIYKNPVRPFISNLDELPFPDREVFYQYKEIREDPVKHFMIGRGCPYKCSYCFNESLMDLYRGKGSYVRLHSIDYILEEIKQVKRLVRIGAIYFHDDTFYLNKKFYNEYLTRYRDEIGIPFICQLRPDLVDEDMIRQLKDANCSAVHMGIETANERIRKDVLKRNISNQQIIDAVKLLKKYDITIMAFNMLGIPGEGIEDAFNTIEFNRRVGVYSRFSIFTPYPNTGVYKYMKEQGFVDGDLDVGRIGQTYFSNSVLTQQMYRKIENLHKFSYILITFPFLKGVIKWLIKLPHNIFFDLLFLASFAIQYSISNKHSLYYTLKLGLKNLRLYFKEA